MSVKNLLLNGLLQGDLDCDGFRLLNIGDNDSDGPFVPITRTINGHNLASDVVLDLTNDFGLSVSALGLNLLVAPTPGANSYLRVNHLDSVDYVLPADIPAEIGLGVTADVTFGNVFVGTDGDFAGLSSHFTVGKSTDSTQYLDFTDGQPLALRNKTGFGAALFVTAGLSLDRAFTLPNASGTIALTSDLVFVSDTAYNATSWNGVTTVAPSKNAVRDKIEAMNPMTNNGDMLYGSSGGAPTRLAGNGTTARKFLRQVGNGVNAGAPTWDLVTADDVGLGSGADVLFGNVFVGVNGDFASLSSLFTVGASMDSLNYLVFENDEYLFLKHRSTSFGVYFNTSLIAADRTAKLPDGDGTFALVEWLVTKTDYTARSGDKIQADTLEGFITITLPASPTPGDCVLIEDAKSNFTTNKLVVVKNGKNINGLGADFQSNTDDQKLSCVFIDEDWGWSIK